MGDNRYQLNTSRPGWREATRVLDRAIAQEASRLQKAAAKHQRAQRQWELSWEAANARLQKVVSQFPAIGATDEASRMAMVSELIRISGVVGHSRERGYHPKKKDKDGPR